MARRRRAAAHRERRAAGAGGTHRSAAPGGRLRLDPRRAVRSRSTPAEARPARRRRSRRVKCWLSCRSWWQIQIDPANRAHDQRFVDQAAAAIEAAEAWTRARAAARRSLVLSCRVVRAARAVAGAARRARSRPRATATGSSARSNDALQLDPSLDDAYFGIGLYRLLRRRRAGGGEDAAVAAVSARAAIV